MSQDILGSLVRALVTVPENRLGLVQDFANKMAGSEGNAWEAEGKLFLRKQPSWAVHVSNAPAAAVPAPEPVIDPATIMPPAGARIHVVRIRVKQDRNWQEAVNAAGPNTPDNYNVRKVGDLYVPVGAEEIEEDLILLNYPSGDGSWDKALQWAGPLGLKNTNPREVFAIGEKHPVLHNQLGLNPMYVVATTECSFGDGRQACYVWWDDAGREAGLDWVSGFVNAGAWFAFRK